MPPVTLSALPAPPARAMPRRALPSMPWIELAGFLLLIAASLA